MNAAMTGGTGFLGQALLRLLLPTAESVRVLVRKSADEELIRALGAVPVRGDLTHDRGCDGLVRQGDIVFHCAAHMEMCGPWSDFERTTVQGTRRLLDETLPRKPRRFVYASSGAVYLRPSTPGMVSAEHTLARPSSYNYYGRAKLEAENLVRRQCEQAGCSWSIVRLGFLYGPGNRLLFSHFTPMLRSGSLRLVGRGDNRIASLDVDDGARAVLLCGTHPAADGRIYDVASDEPVTQREFLNATADVLGLPRPGHRVPYGLAFLAAGLGEWLARLAGRRARITRAMVVLMAIDQIVDTGPIRDELGWKPETCFSDGMERTRQWYLRQQGVGFSPTPRAGGCSGRQHEPGRS
ncbi:MAG TPA: NAD-dependent epimerase/dehydratase family protein [Phycisphaerae bacterium]|nr:NAD-dependent epimerase/dehydratase family protein [Phycisphaerae bacterium]